MFISTLLVRAVVAEIENRGLSGERLLRAGGLERATLAQPAQGVGCRDFDRIVRQAMELTGDPGLGLTIGARAPEAMLHVLGMLLITSRTLRDAFDHLRRYGSLVVSEVDWQLVESGPLTSFGYTFAVEPGAAQAAAMRFLADCALLLALRIGRHFAPMDVPVELRLKHAAPAYAARYAESFGCSVRFGQADNALVFKSELLDREQPHADAQLVAVLCNTADKLQQEASGALTFGDRVRVALRYETDLARVDFDAMARRWGVTRRVLRRRISAEKLSLSELLEEARCRRAVEELRRIDSKIKDVAEDLGYSETSAFHRAFKRWTGSTPSHYKAELRRAAHASSRSLSAGFRLARQPV